MKVLAIIFLVLAAALILIGISFKIQHWPGASISLLMGILFSLLGCLFYILSRFKNKNKLDNILDV
jgi:hypothetical protein